VVDCYGKCIENSLCDCWTLSENLRQCYLKGAPCPSPKNITGQTLISGMKICPFLRDGPNYCYFKDADQIGYDIGSSGGIKNSTGCQEICQTRAGCQCWAHVLNTDTCWFKSQCPSYSHSEGLISGPAKCS